MGGHKYQNGSDRWFLQHLEEGIAGSRVHCMGIGDNHHPHSGLIRFQCKGLTEGANLTDFDEQTERFYPDDVRMVTRFDFAA